MNLDSPSARPRLPLSAVLLAAFVAGVLVGRLAVPSSNPPPPKSKTTGAATDTAIPGAIETGLVREVWDLLHEKFVGNLDDSELARGVLRGIAASTGDPYTQYADPAESEHITEELSGSFGGIGIEITLRRGLVTVIAPLRDSPADRAGIEPRDIITKINGEELTPADSLTEIVSRIRGPAGTTVTLTTAREGEGDPRDYTITREKIQLQSVLLSFRDDVAVLTLSAFNEDTGQLLRRAVRQLRLRGARGILLDLRNNPGGILEQAVTVAGHFLPAGTTVVTEVPKDSAARATHQADGPSDVADLPVVVLINGGSASAAEILAAALAERRQAPLVGEATFGKGSVQEVVELSDGSSLIVTVAAWHTSTDQKIAETGLSPTVHVKDETPDADPDEVLDKGLAVLRELIGDR